MQWRTSPCSSPPPQAARKVGRGCESPLETSSLQYGASIRIFTSSSCAQAHVVMSLLSVCLPVHFTRSGYWPGSASANDSMSSCRTSLRVAKTDGKYTWYDARTSLQRYLPQAKAAARASLARGHRPRPLLLPGDGAKLLAHDDEEEETLQPPATSIRSSSRSDGSHTSMVLLWGVTYHWWSNLS